MYKGKRNKPVTYIEGLPRLLNFSSKKNQTTTEKKISKNRYKLEQKKDEFNIYGEAIQLSVDKDPELE
tara:strand:+ start:48 stop:251 length:204 start_codon:yes stop_codon:yes gene_type:complete